MALHKTLQLQEYEKKEYVIKDTVLEETVFFAQQCFGKFYKLPVARIDEFMRALESDHNYYEYVPSNTLPVRMYFDLDLKQGIEWTQELCNSRLDLFFKWFLPVFNAIVEPKGYPTLDRENFVIMSSCRAEKLSFHLVEKDFYYFRGIADLQKLIEYLTSSLEILTSRPLSDKTVRQ